MRAVTTPGRPPGDRATPSAAAGPDRRLVALDAAMVRDGRRVLFISGPAGYGKTHLVQRWVDERRQAGCAVVSATAPAAPPHVISAIVEAIAALGGDPRVGSHDLADLVDAAAGGLGPTGADALAAVLASVPSATIVLDLEGTHQPLPVLAELAQLWLRPDLRHLTLVVVSRARPPAEVAPLIVQGHIGHLDEQLLELQPDEVAELLADRHGASARLQLVAQIRELAAGWPLGVAVLGAALDDPPTTLDRAHELLAEYLAVEVIDALPGDQLEVLATLALFERFTPELIAHLAAEQAEPVLRSFHELRAGSCFIRGSGERGWLALHPILRSALRRSPHQLEPERRRRLLERAARWFIDEGRPIEAAWCHRWLGDWKVGGEILTSHLATILRTDQLDQLLEITKELPIPLQVENLTWSMGIAWLEISTGRLPSGLARLAMLERYCDDHHLKQLLALRAGSAPFRHDPQPALLAAERALALLDGSEPGDLFEDVFLVLRPSHFRAQIRANALVAGAYLGAWEQVLHHDVPVDSVIASELSPTTLYAIHGRRATFHALAGNPRRALAIAHEARVLREARDDLVVTAQNQVELAEAAALRGRGRSVEAAAVLDASDPLPPTATNRRAWLASQRAELACDGGEPWRALDVVRRAVDEAPVPPAPLLGSLLAAASARAHLLLHDPAAAEAAVAGAPDSLYTRWWRVLVLLARAELGAATACVEAWPDETVPAGQVRRKLALVALADQRGTTVEADRAFAEVAELIVAHQLVQPVLELGAQGRALVARADCAVATIAALGRLLPDPPALPDDDLLTPAEARIMNHLAQQLTMREVADRLHLSVNTVKSHARRIYRKLDVSGRAEAVDRWVRSRPR